MEKVHVDKDLCIACGSCVAICPDNFEFGEDNLAEAKTEEVTDDDFKWLYEGITCSTSNIKQLLRQRTAFSDVDINKALDVVKDTMRKNGKTTCEVKEENSTFDFIILR